MLRFVALFTLFTLYLYGCNGGYGSCERKLKDSHSIHNHLLSLPVTKHTRLLYSKTKPKGIIIKHDPFLALYLIEDKKGFTFPFRANAKLLLGVALVDASHAIEGKIIKHQIGLNHLAQFSEKIFTPSVLLTSCCSLEGIATPDGIIERAYIEHFLKTKKVEYGDIGIRIKDEKNLVTVESVNPFLAHNPFVVDDCIVAFDGKKVHNSALLMQKILFSKVGSYHNVKIKRKKKFYTYRIKVLKRKGGGEKSDTFLEFLGLSFDKNLHIIKIEPKAKKYKLKLGDTLVQINHQDIKTQEQIGTILAKRKKDTYLLFQRYDFQFFVKVN